MIKLVDKYFAISPKNNPHSVADIDGKLYPVRDSRYYYYTLDAAKEAFLEMTGEEYTDLNNPTQYYIIEIVTTLETNRI